MRCLFVLLALTASGAFAQIAPSPEDVAGYRDYHLAAHGNDARTVRALADSGVALETRDRHGRTAVHVAAFASADDALRALAEAGADMNTLEHGLYDAVTIAAVADDPELMSLAIALGNRPDQVTSIYDGTALIAAAHLGHAEVVRRLIAAGAPLDHVNNLGWTALIEAVVLGDGGSAHQQTVRALVGAGANRGIPDRSGMTPLQHAEQRGYREIEVMLREE